MNKHLEVDVGVHLVGPGHREVEPGQGLHVVILETKVMPVKEAASLLSLSNTLHQEPHGDSPKKIFAKTFSPNHGFIEFKLKT
jgi:hypothetical protein